DREAIQALAEELVKHGLKELTPDLYKAVSWFTWAKKGMELFKDFVFDPWLEGQQMETYAARRDEGSEPADAFASGFGWGHTRERVLKQLEREGFNMKILWVNGEKGKLSPAWEAHLERFVIASFEHEYARKLISRAGKQARAELIALDTHVVELVQQRAPAKPTAIHVVAGTYGANCAGFANGKYRAAVGHGNVTGNLAAQCDGKSDCTYKVVWQTISDPAFGCAKDYVAEWRCDGDSTIHKASAGPEA